MSKLVITATKGGPGSGNFGHAGRPGEVGGSAPKGSSRPIAAKPPETQPRQFTDWKEAEAWVQEHGEPESAMSMGEQNAIYDYTEGGFYFTNGLLRGTVDEDEADGPIVRKYIAALDAMEKRGHIPEDVTLYRGFNTDNEMRPGQIVSDKGFVSTSVMRGTADHFLPGNKKYGVLLKIHAHKGSNAIIVTIARKEGEVILPRGSRFKVKSVTWNEGKSTYEAEVDHLSG